MASGNIVTNFLAKVLKPSSNLNQNQSDIEMEFHGQFSVDENSLNGLTIGGMYIPEEIILEIFVHLNIQDILNCSLVCKRWCNIAKSNALWQTIYNQKEHPRKAKNLPWYVFYCYFATDNFKNLIQNGNGEKQFNHWTILANGGDEFKIEDPPVGSDPLPDGIPDFNGYTSCFATSYAMCSKYQTIHLSPKRLLQFIIKKYKPTLYLSEWYSGRFDCSCVYRLAVRCDTQDNRWKPDGYSRFGNIRAQPEKYESTHLNNYLKFQKDEIAQFAGKAWKKMEVKTNNYPVNVDKIYFCHEGQDCKFWKGHYGSKMAGGVLKFVFESIEPTSDDIADKEEIFQN